jgi:hypothetical protein
MNTTSTPPSLVSPIQAVIDADIAKHLAAGRLKGDESPAVAKVSQQSKHG